MEAVCPFCQSIQVERLGELGSVVHGRCRSCGVVFPVEVVGALDEFEHEFDHTEGIGVDFLSPYCR